jgi:peptidoglycan hydrolase CwlO-like protein
MSKVDRAAQLQTEIVTRVKSINKQKEEKKTIVSAYNETIKALEAERDALVQELDELKEAEKRQALVEEADEIIQKNARPSDDSLALVD